MISTITLKMQASVKDEFILSRLGKVVCVVIEYKSHIQTGLTNLEHTIKFMLCKNIRFSAAQY